MILKFLMLKYVFSQIKDVLTKFNGHILKSGPIVPHGMQYE